MPVFADTAHLLIAFPVERPSDIPAPDPAVEIVLSPTAIQHALATMSGGLQAWQASMMRMAAAFEEAQRRAEQAMKPIADRLSKLGVSLSDPPKQTGRLHPSIGRPMFGPGSQSRRRF